MELKKPRCLNEGDTIATVSISLGWAGDKGVLWKYQLGKKILEPKFPPNYTIQLAKITRLVICL